jgi:hypothetical protein
MVRRIESMNHEAAAAPGPVTIGLDASRTLKPLAESRENRDFATEMKFLVHPEVAPALRAWVRSRLDPDPHAGGAEGDEYLITSLYLDNAERDVFHRRGSFGRSKFRIRRYGHSDVVFLERKLRTRRLLTKRRTGVSMDALDRLQGPPLLPGDPIFWFDGRVRLRRLRPVCQVSYHRTARVATGAHGLIRLTLDQTLCGLAVDSWRFVRGAGSPLPESSVIVEMKFRFQMPALFKALAEEFGLTPRPFSKYRLAASALGIAAEPADPATARRSAEAGSSWRVEPWLSSSAGQPRRDLAAQV